MIEDLLRAVFRTVAQIKRTVSADEVDGAAIIVLSRMRDAGPVRLSDLAAELALDLSTVSRQVKALEERGLLVRTDDPGDRRAALLEIAPAGNDVLAKAWARRQAWLSESLADWSPEDRAALAAVLHRFADSLHAEPAPHRPKTETSA